MQGYSLIGAPEDSKNMESDLNSFFPPIHLLIKFYVRVAHFKCQNHPTKVKLNLKSLLEYTIKVANAKKVIKQHNLKYILVSYQNTLLRLIFAISYIYADAYACGEFQDY